MSDAIALAKHAIARQRTSLIILVAIVLTGLVAAFSLASIGTQDARGFAFMAMTLTMFPATVWTFGLFVFGHDGDMMDSESGFNPWLLRMPIAAWKLALVPVVLKTLWIFALWITFVLAMRYIVGANEQVSLLNPAMAFSATGVWLMVVAWRPFSSGWWRLCAILCCGVALLACVIGAFIVDDDVKLEPWARQLFGAGIYVMYATGVWMSVRALQLARTNSGGLISEKKKWISQSQLESDVRVRDFASPRRALLWHDLRKSRALFQWFCLLGVVPGTLFLILFVPFSAPGYVGTVVLFAYIGFGVATNVIDKTSKGAVAMPPHLAAGPFSTAEIAWTRLVTICAIILVPLLCSLVVFAGWAMWPENRAAWSKWAGEMTVSTGSATAGFQIAAATFLATCVVLIGRAASFVWPAFCGRNWIHFSSAVGIAIGYMIPVSIVIVWFLKQVSWEGAKASAIHWASYLPAIVVTLLIAKSICVAIAMLQLRSRQLVSPRGIGLLVGGWFLLTCILTVVFHLLIPHPLATIPWCFAAVALCIPLVRVLVLPISLQFGRHL